MKTPTAIKGKGKYPVINIFACVGGYKVDLCGTTYHEYVFASKDAVVDFINDHLADPAS